ncbi:tRNA (guanosine(46)-N7)-methyltransferase TrmB [Tsukamurella sp. 8F]|uniref:tRNA (guanosine(46)-N7)-methyltransferase TrmB n=1 Tax=unclassified Tsukamurella TaxID=2633480 RepID=UPI0023B95E40|nr:MULTISPECIES: tRNA (guanosine(46)-N7)-methyltransferase TrmB [unclassified Tsukamurella]MDF0529900.1 tRNA (guanosine(46)-N7)-methyltransferase TrmB [Tsukamurella sp. 8J]MDF0588645.1 tRNA (guanosine(46)-N7)-methyltransferase TrmB [Tsukamurella sp. 8F]
MSQPLDPGAEHRRLYPRVTSFRSRRGALTPAQQRVCEEMWPGYARDIPPAAPLDPNAPAAVGPEEYAPADRFPAPPEPLDAPGWFGRVAPLVVEIGCGTGTSTVAMAAAEPDVNVLAVEVYVPGIAQLLRGLQDRRLENVRVVRGDGVAVLEDMIAPGVLEGARVFFPDPWPKARHHKRRLLQPRTFSLLASRVRPGGIVHVATDHADYAEWIGQVGDGEPSLRRVPLPPDLANARLPISVDRPVTKFQGKAEQVGREIHEFVWERLR